MHVLIKAEENELKKSIKENGGSIWIKKKGVFELKEGERSFGEWESNFVWIEALQSTIGSLTEGIKALKSTIET